MKERPVANYLGSYISWVMDSYDLGAVVITSTILQKLFYPNLGVIGAVLPIVFTIVSRPLGGFIFGYIADVYGRKKTLIITVLGYSLSVGVTAILPTYYQIGIMASIILLILRGLQGIFIGGDVSSSFATAMESVRKMRGLFGGIMQSGALVGFSIVDFLYAYFSSIPSLAVDSWRYIFAIGALPAALAVFIRARMTEPRIYVESKKDNPIKGLKPLRQTILVMIGFWMMIYAGPQFAPVFFGKYLHLSQAEIGMYALYMNLAGIPAMMIAGTISDFLGRKFMGIVYVLLAVIGAWIFYFGGFSLYTVLLFGFLINFPPALTPSYLAERFKTFSRATGVGFSYNGAFIVAGFTPLLISLVSTKLPLNTSAFSLLTLGSIIAILGFALGPETLRNNELTVNEN